MARRLVVADASPLIGLVAAGAFDLLRRLYGQVTITESVRDEVLAGVLIAARQHEYEDNVRALLEKLEACNFRLSREVVDTILELAGES